MSLAVFCWAGLLSSAASAEGMLVPGTFNVTDKGAATYNIPITVPPGTAGMVPSLALEYSSQGGSGLAGMGWSLTGLPSIGRCAKTVAQDGVKGAVNYDANDRFCMEGQRLVAVSGTYGADGTEYRTEIEGFSKVKSYGTAGTGPAWFEVRTKTGQIMQFGNTTDSRILAQGKTTARGWGVNKITDTKGNYLTVTYTNDTVNGQVYPTRIDYTGNAAAGVSPYNSVQLVYETRPDISPVYHAGSLIRTTVRLTDIKTYQGANLVLDYKLAYDTLNYDLEGSLAGSTKRSRLASVKLCTDTTGTNCLPATTFSPTGNANQFSWTTSGTFDSSWGVPIGGDFNGDGKADLLILSVTVPTVSKPEVVWLSNGDGTFNSIAVGNRPVNEILYGNVLSGDFDGDGKTDIFFCTYVAPQCKNDAAYLWKSNGDGTFTQSSLGSPTGPSIAVAGDFNGDGRTDIYFYLADEYGRTNSNPNSYPWWSAGGGTFSGNTVVDVPSSAIVLAADFNGDGNTDLFYCHADQKGRCDQTSAILKLANGDQTFRSNISVAGIPAGYKPILGDFNGDGLTDIFFCEAEDHGHCKSTISYFWTNKGDGTFSSTSMTMSSDFSTYSLGAIPGDYNGDGKTDILFCDMEDHGRCTGADSSLLMWISTGAATPTVLHVPPLSASILPPYPGDYDGDGNTDIFFCKSNSSTANPGCKGLSGGTYLMQRAYVAPEGSTATTAPAPDLLSSFTTGFGLTTSIAYRPLSQDGWLFYARDNTAVYPVVDIAPSMYVVRSVAAANGIGGTYSSMYWYNGAKADLSGRGFLGFKSMAAYDLQSLIVQATYYRQDYPFIGMVSQQDKILNTSPQKTLNQKLMTYDKVSLGGTRYFVAPTQTLEKSWDLTGTELPAITTATPIGQYDAYGNPLQVTVSTPDGSTKKTVNTYTNDTTNWILGRLTNAQVTSTVPAP